MKIIKQYICLLLLCVYFHSCISMNPQRFSRLFGLGRLQVLLNKMKQIRELWYKAEKAAKMVSEVFAEKEEEKKYVIFRGETTNLNYLLPLKTHQNFASLSKLFNKLNSEAQDLIIQTGSSIHALPELSTDLEEKLKAISKFNPLQQFQETNTKILEQLIATFNKNNYEKLEINLQEGQVVVSWDPQTNALLKLKEAYINSLYNEIKSKLEQKINIDPTKKLMFIDQKWNYIETIQNAQNNETIEFKKTVFDTSIKEKNIFPEITKPLLEQVTSPLAITFEKHVREVAKTFEQIVQTKIETTPTAISLFTTEQQQNEQTKFVLEQDKIEKKIKNLFFINIDHQETFPHEKFSIIQQYSDALRSALKQVLIIYSDINSRSVKLFLEKKDPKTRQRIIDQISILYREINKEILKKRDLFNTKIDHSTRTITIIPTPSITQALKEYKNVQAIYDNLQQKITSIKDEQLRRSLQESLQNIKIQEESFYLKPENQKKLSELQKALDAIRNKIPSFIEQTIQDVGATITKIFTQSPGEQLRQKQQNLVKIMKPLINETRKKIWDEQIQNIVKSEKPVTDKLTELDQIQRNIEQLILEENEKKKLYRSIINTQKTLQEKINNVQDVSLKEDLKNQLQNIALPEKDEKAQILLKEKKEFEEIQKNLDDIEKKIPTVLDKIGTLFKEIFGGKKEQ